MSGRIIASPAPSRPRPRPPRHLVSAAGLCVAFSPPSVHHYRQNLRSVPPCHLISWFENSISHVPRWSGLSGGSGHPDSSPRPPSLRLPPPHDLPLCPLWNPHNTSTFMFQGFISALFLSINSVIFCVDKKSFSI